MVWYIFGIVSQLSWIIKADDGRINTKKIKAYIFPKPYFYFEVTELNSKTPDKIQRRRKKNHKCILNVTLYR